MSGTGITLLNSMADRDFATALDRHVEWGLRHLDLKDAIFGKSVVDISDPEAHRAAGLITERGLSVYCLSTNLFHEDVECGEEEFRRDHFARVDRAIEIARAFDTPADTTFPFERGRVPVVCFAGMMEYDGDLHIPNRYLVAPPCVDRTVGEFLAELAKKLPASVEVDESTLQVCVCLRGGGGHGSPPGPPQPP